MREPAIAYRGQRGPNDTALVYRVLPGGREELIDPRLDLFNHSPTGVEWGYYGSGPAQLALAIVADLLNDDERAVRIHQQFKAQVIANLSREASWLLTKDEAAQTIAEITLRQMGREW
jgi:hypothetical protein